MVGAMMKLDPARRITAQQALARPWFRQMEADDGS